MSKLEQLTPNADADPTRVGRDAVRNKVGRRSLQFCYRQQRVGVDEGNALGQAHVQGLSPKRPGKKARN